MGRQTLMRSMWGIMPWNVTAWNGYNEQVGTGHIDIARIDTAMYPAGFSFSYHCHNLFCADNKCYYLLVGIVSALSKLAHCACVSLGMGITIERHAYKNTREVIV